MGESVVQCSVPKEKNTKYCLFSGPFYFCVEVLFGYFDTVWSLWFVILHLILLGSHGCHERCHFSRSSNIRTIMNQ